MKSHVEVVTEVGTSLGDITVEEITVVTSDGDVFDEYYNVSLDGEVKHSRCTAKAAIRALGTYLNAM
jgi:hypothetical protein